jgi:ubiquinone/menaquinone biosynthesis C-methylase UbiE
MAKRNIRQFNSKKVNNSWQKVGKWYGKITEGEGHYYHRNVIVPSVLKLLHLGSNSKVLDMGSGSGILGRSLSERVEYVGVDLSETLLKEAKRQDKSFKHHYILNDASNLDIKENNFSHAVFILSLQNMREPEKAIKSASEKLKDGGKLLLVLNHPAFRIPRQSSWGIDPNNKIEYRRVNKYMSNMEIPINMNPSDKNSEMTWSYHYPISEVTKMLSNNGFLIENIEEWTSDKVSEGSASKMENRARAEFPLFMAILGVKKAN